MESVVTTQHSELKKQVRAKDLASILDQLPSQVKILSLDCFDTLLWRKTATPGDNFYDMQNSPTFASIGMTAKLRAVGEKRARQKMQIDYGITEVKLKDIYLGSYPDLTDDQLNALAQEEIAAEIATCYAFPPVVDLIRQAHKRGMKIIIVSDTYLQEKELRQLLDACMPPDIMPMIMKIFCSCDHGYSKNRGLFKKVFAEIYEKPNAIFHLGDNGVADYSAPQALGVHAVHLLHNEKKVGNLIRMQALASGFIDPAIRYKRSLVNPFLGMYASSAFSADNPESMVGYLSAGPIMYAFASYICDAVKKMESEGKRPKLCFLMRDAYLPYLACNAMAGKEMGKCVFVSRFASYASSFYTKDDVDKYMYETSTSLRFYDMCIQLLLPEKIAAEISDKAARKTKPIQAFIELVRQKKIMNLILSNSKDYRKRLKQHLINEVGVQPDDTLVFIDLGYGGTAQLKLEPMFRNEMNVDIVGLYLIALRIPDWDKNRSGLLDPSNCDDRILHMLVAYIALLEQLCTSNSKSVIDYDEKGNPIYSKTSVSKAQHGKLEKIQAECIRFIHEAKQFFKDANTTVSPRVLRDFTLAELTRLLFLPTQTDLEYLKSFEFDLNLGTKDLLEVFDEEKGLTGLRRRGLFFMEKNLKSMRTNYPAELRSASLELVLTLMAQHRFGFDIRKSDFSLRHEKLNVIAIHAGKASQTSIEASPTYDGYFSLIVPVGAGDIQVGIQFGLPYQWVQIESAELIVANALYGSHESDHTEDAIKNMIVDQMVEKGGGLYECQSETSLLVYVPNGQLNKHNYALRVVFRPTVIREKKA